VAEQRVEILAATIARARVPLGFACAGVVLWLARPTSQSLVVGGAIALAGEAVRIWAAGHLEKGREVTQSGPYRITRHPLYIGSAVIALGAAVATAQPGAMVLIAAYMAVTILSAIHHEEAGMRASFGDQYDAYAQSRALLRAPRSGGQAQPVERPFSLARAMKNKEHKAVAGLAAVAAILWAKAFLQP
jgi:protein-S-isoprenylcysteine O-methyltransferase Ste14